MIPSQVLAAVEYARKNGATACVWQYDAGKTWRNNTTSWQATVAIFSSLHGNDLDRIYDALPDSIGSFAYVRCPSQNTKVALTLAGFRKIGGNLWQWTDT